MENQQNQIPEYEPWNQDTYRTGSTNPPKNRGGVIAVLLIAVIFLCGIVTILGFMNVRLFRQINEAQNADTLPIVFSQNGEDPSLDTSHHEDTQAAQETGICLEQSPQGVENVPQAGGLSLQQIYDETIRSVVSISCSYHGGSSTGTGVVLTQNGYIVTNCHVVEGAQTIRVLLSDGREEAAELVGTDAVSDLAVLRIYAEDLSPAQWGDSTSLRVGDSVVAIGDPLGIELRGSMTDGIVSAINRDIDVDGRTMNLIQTNAALNSGNSGGPLINCYGQVIGINTMKMGDAMSIAGVEGLGFAIPSTTVKEVVDQLISQGYVSGRPTLGIWGDSITSFYQYMYGFPQGLYITEVKNGSSADKAGIVPGDLLLSIDGVSITSNDDLRTQLYAYSPGDTLEAVIFRNYHQYSVTLTVGEANS